MALGAAAVTAASLGAAAVVGGSAAGASARAGIPTVTVHVGNGRIGVVGGDGSPTLHAGRIHFRVITGGGDHILQILRLRHGYTLQDAGHDFGPAFSGNTAAIGRLDDNVIFRGGARALPDKPGSFVVTLRAGQFYFIDQNSNAVKAFRVVGTPPVRPTVPHAGQITAYSFGFGAVPETLPANGTLFFYNQADQPHFLEMQRVKDGTTDRQVKQFLANGARGNPPWALRAGTGAGVISPRFGQMLSYNLPAGEYLIACFWPDRFTGMPHFFMGMWKLIHLA